MIRKCLLTICFLFCSYFAASLFASEKPNIIYIMSDDHAAHAIGAYGGRLAELNPTPTLDRLAREGMLFENVFCTNSICTPSRACVLTGQYPHTNGVYDLTGEVQPENQYLAIEMKKAGYQTAMVGKWHLKTEPASFDFYTVLPGQGDYHNPVFRVRGEKPWGQNTIQFEDTHSSDAITDITLDWLKKRDTKKPFFLMHHYKAPHDYFEHAHRYDDYLKEVDIPMPKNLWPENQPDFGSIATLGHNNELFAHIGTSIGDRNPRRSYSVDLPKLFPQDYPDDFDPKNYKEREITKLAYNAYLKKYLRCIKGIDDNLARLFKHLEETGQMDNTVIMYTGDQGFMLGEHDYQDKRWMYEESLRMPFLVRYPKEIKAGGRSDAIIENVDFAPTMLAFAGSETPEYMQGKSFKPICDSEGKEPTDWKQEAYYRYWMHMAHHDNPGHIGIRTKTHKLIYYYGCGYQGEYRTPPSWELYDLSKDPQENVNQYTNPSYKKTVTDLKQRLQALRKRVGDTGKDFPKCEAIVQEFWDYDSEDQEEAIKLSNSYKQRREIELSEKNYSDVKINYLFGGKNLNNWTFKEDGWKIDANGAMTCNFTTRKVGNGSEKKVGMGFIWSKKPYGDFILNMEYKLSQGANSGVFFRTDPSNPVQGGFEIQLLDDANYRNLKPTNQNGALYDAKAAEFNPSKKVGAWNHLSIVCKGDLLSVKINRKSVLFADLSQWTEGKKNPDGSGNKFKTALSELPKAGHIGFQNHGQQVWFRKIQLKDLSDQ